MNDPLTEARFWAQVTTDAERTIICSPVTRGRVREWIDKTEFGHLFTLLANPTVGDDVLYIVDHHAIDAAHERALQQAITEWWRP